MKITKKSTREELLAAIVGKLQEHGLSAVLVGGAVVSIYSENKYESKDLDFISPDSDKDLKAAMEELGFKKKGKDYVHPQTDFFVEFPTGPIAIGSEVPVKPEGTLKLGGVVVKLFSPTQCVMDRLAAWYHWNDPQSLEQALLVAKAQPIKLSKVKAWSQSEGSLEKYERFLARLKNT